MIEIQVRTSLQHLWAELSEKLSDVVDRSAKYGGGNKSVRMILTDTSIMGIGVESLETDLAEMLARFSSEDSLTKEEIERMISIERGLSSVRHRMYNYLRDTINLVEKLKKERRMIFLIEYDRNRGRIVTFEIFEDIKRQEAEDARLEMELGLNRLAVEREVVILEAESEEALRRTHRRYFEDLAELVSAPA